MVSNNSRALGADMETGGRPRANTAWTALLTAWWMTRLVPSGRTLPRSDVVALPGRAFRRWIFRCDVQIALSRAIPKAAPALRRMSAMAVRLLSQADLEHLHPELARQRAAFQDNLGQQLEGFAAFDGQQAVAVCWFARHQAQDPARLKFSFGSTQLYTFSLAVASPYRHTGIAATLQWQAWAYYSAAGFTELIRLVSLGNQPALKLHLHMGFRPCGRGRRMFHILDRRLSREFAHHEGAFDAELPWRPSAAGKKSFERD